MYYVVLYCIILRCTVLTYNIYIYILYYTIITASSLAFNLGKLGVFECQARAREHVAGVVQAQLTYQHSNVRCRLDTAPTQ